MCFETLKTLPKKALRTARNYELLRSSKTAVDQVRNQVDGLWRPWRVRETHPPGGRSGVPAGCWEHTESGTPCFALRRRRARRPGRAAPVRRPRGTADRTSAAARLSRRDRSTTLNRTCLSPDNRTVHSSPSFSRQYFIVSVKSVRMFVSRVRERRAVAGLSVFQVSRVTKGRSRRSSQNENRTNEHHLIIYKF